MLKILNDFFPCWFCVVYLLISLLFLYFAYCLTFPNKYLNILSDFVKKFSKIKRVFFAIIFLTISLYFIFISYDSTRIYIKYFSTEKKINCVN